MALILISISESFISSYSIVYFCFPSSASSDQPVGVRPSTSALVEAISIAFAGSIMAEKSIDSSFSLSVSTSFSFISFVVASISVSYSFDESKPSIS